MSDGADSGRVEWTAPGYSDHWEPLTGRFAAALLDALDPAPGARILDVGCGTGVVARVAAERGVSVLGLDYSISMARWAGRRLGASRFAAGDACRPPLAPAMLDGVTMGFSLHHLPDPAAALREIAAALRAGGRLAYATWAGPEANPENARIDAVYERYLDDTAESGDDGAFSFGVLDECAAALGEVGFDPRTVRATEITYDWRPGTPDAVFDAELLGGGPNSRRLSREPAARIAEIRAAVREIVADYRTDDGIAIPMTAVVVAVEAPAGG